jgi:D-alanyl-D-alanine carboxypeptidase
MMTDPRMRHLAAIALAPLLIVASTAAAQPNITAAIDAIVEAPIKAGRIAGASVAIARGSQMILDKGYGLADLQLEVPTPPRAVYEIGSVTKQFTAAGILLLAEDGKLSLDDEITKFLPDYPTHGHRVTVRHLLDHTSGIKSYTELAEFRNLSPLKKPRQELVDLFSSQPFDFAPGDELIYNNSAYFLAGLIIEKLSGQPYADFVQVRFFDRLGMHGSSYCSERQIRKHKVQGYDTEDGVLVLKAYLDHMWPYAAGSLCSTVGDLVLWTRALHGGKVLTPSSYRAMITPGALSDGTPVRYAMGVTAITAGGRRLISHGGGINGFLSELAYYPDDDLVIAVLVNTAGPVSAAGIAREIADAVLGKRSTTDTTYNGDLAAFAGSYAGRGRGGPTQIRLEARGSALHLIRESGASKTDERLQYLGNDTFALRDTLLIFQLENGAVVGVRMDTVGANVALARSAAGTQ